MFAQIIICACYRLQPDRYVYIVALQPIIVIAKIPGNAGVGMADEGLFATGLEGGIPSGLGGGLPRMYGGTGRFLGGGVTKIGAQLGSMKGLLTPPLPGGGRGRFLGPGNRFGGRGRFSGCGFGGRGWAEIMAVGRFPGNSEVGR